MTEKKKHCTTFEKIEYFIKCIFDLSCKRMENKEMKDKHKAGS